jgi:hypothetical protein
LPGDGRLSHRKADLERFAVDARRASKQEAVLVFITHLQSGGTFLDQSWPRRVNSRTRSSSRRTSSRYPSCLISCAQSGPLRGLSPAVGRHGSMNPRGIYAGNARTWRFTDSMRKANTQGKALKILPLPWRVDMLVEKTLGQRPRPGAGPFADKWPVLILRVARFSYTHHYVSAPPDACINEFGAVPPVSYCVYGRRQPRESATTNMRRVPRADGAAVHASTYRPLPDAAML